MGLLKQKEVICSRGIEIRFGSWKDAVEISGMRTLYKMVSVLWMGDMAVRSGRVTDSVIGRQCCHESCVWCVWSADTTKTDVDDVEDCDVDVRHCGSCQPVGEWNSV